MTVSVALRGLTSKLGDSAPEEMQMESIGFSVPINKRYNDSRSC
jgi:hypothetical protein